MGDALSDAPPDAPPDASTIPLIGLPACRWRIDDQDYHVAGEKYLLGAALAVGGVPIIIPALAIPALEEADHAAATIRRLDGLLVTGSPSNVEPGRYGGPPSAAGTRHDPARDDITLRLIPAALAAGVPVFAICRGLQELNVALGGSLHQRIQDLPGKRDHRARADDPIEIRYGLAHKVRLEPGGALAGIAGDLVDERGEIEVNSLHSQGIDRLAPGLAVEAAAPDGIIEAVRVVDAANFAIGVQWHPEWRVADDPFSGALFAAFGAACRARAARPGAGRCRPRAA